MMKTNRCFGYYRSDITSDAELERLKDEISYERDLFSDDDIAGTNLETLMNMLQSNDDLYIVSLNQLSRNIKCRKDILEQLKAKKVYLHILDIPSTMDCFFSEIVVNILLDQTIKQIEREARINSDLQALGIRQAKSNGVKLGRKPKAIPSSFKEDIKAWRNGKVTAASLYRSYGWSNPCFYKYVRLFESGMMV